MRGKWEKGEYASEEAFVEERVAKVTPVLETLYKNTVEKKKKAVEGSEFDKALNYLLNNWEALKAYPHCFYATPDNNEAERSTRPFSMGSKAWMFAKTPSGASASALMYTLVQNAKLNNISPADYLWAVFEQAPGCKTEDDWQALLPWKIDLNRVQAKKGAIRAAKSEEGRTETYIIRGGSY